MTGLPPRAAFGSFDKIHEIYYGTDDGYHELSPREEPHHNLEHVNELYEVFRRFTRFHANLDAQRRDNIHLVSVVGGLYGLNLIPIFRPKELTFFDINPHQVSLFQLIRRVWLSADDAEDFLEKLTTRDYPVEGEQERYIQNCLAARQQGCLTEEQGRSARSLRSSWRYALDHFQLTRDILADAPVHTRVDGMHSPEFARFVAENQNLWVFCSNVLWFVHFQLTFHHPENAVVCATYFKNSEILDVGKAGQAPVTVNFRQPLSLAQDLPITGTTSRSR